MHVHMHMGGGVWRVEANIWGQKMEMVAQWELLGVCLTLK